MSRSYPIWNDVEACIYKYSKSYGARDTSSVTIYVGTSGSNSHELVQHCTTKREEGDYTIFRFGVNLGKSFRCLKIMYMHTKTGKILGRRPKALSCNKKS